MNTHVIFYGFTKSILGTVKPFLMQYGFLLELKSFSTLFLTELTNCPIGNLSLNVPATFAYMYAYMYEN